MLAAARIGVFIQRGAVETRQPVRVLGKVRRHPVEQYADAVLVTYVHEIAEIVRAAIAAGRREITGGLVTPGGVIGMFCHRQQLNVREAHVRDIVHQAVGQLPVGEKFALGAASP